MVPSDFGSCRQTGECALIHVCISHLIFTSPMGRGKVAATNRTELFTPLLVLPSLVQGSANLPMNNVDFAYLCVWLVQQASL